MAEVTRVDPKEIARREAYIREYHRPRSLKDPFTWGWPYRTAGFAFAVGLGASHLHNLWLRKPWTYALYTRLATITVFAGFAYAMGTLREYHYRSRDAVTEHYKQIHAGEFTALEDIYGRPFADVLLPWYPHRAQYRRNE